MNNSLNLNITFSITGLDVSDEFRERDRYRWFRVMVETR